MGQIDEIDSFAHIVGVYAHPDDESFGLGALLAIFGNQKAEVSALCFTHGEASTLGIGASPLGEVRSKELAEAAKILGIGQVTLLDYPDGRLSETPSEELAVDVLRVSAGADLLLVFDLGGITGHPDHHRATQAALTAADIADIAVLAWAIPTAVASKLNSEFETSFQGRSDVELDLTLAVDRDLQRKAIACHYSQARDNPVLWRRLELLGSKEHLRWLRRPSSHSDLWAS